MTTIRNLFLCACVTLLAACSEAPQGQAPTLQLPEPQSAGAEVMRKHCSSCHAPPAATVHPAEEWPNVVYRMSERLRLKGYPPMSEDEMKVLTEYLQKHSKS